MYFHVNVIINTTLKGLSSILAKCVFDHNHFVHKKLLSISCFIFRRTFTVGIGAINSPDIFGRIVCFRRKGHEAIDFLKFVSGEVAPLAYWNVQSYVHDANPF